jgi:hypothetical protein
MIMPRFNKNLFNNIVLKFFFVFKLWGYFLQKLIKFNFFFINFFLYKNFLLYFTLLSQNYYINEYLKIKNNIIKRHSLLYYNNSLPKQAYGSWNYYIQWINVYI